MEDLILVYPTNEYKEDVLAMLEEVRIVDKSKPWQYAGFSSLEISNSYEEWIIQKNSDKKGINLPDGYVAASTFLCVRKSDNSVVGICNIRHELTDYLFNYGGHIGQSIKPSERGKGYGYQQLKLAIEESRKLNLTKVLVTCNEENIASARTIEKCLGKYENTVGHDGESIKRYWIDIKK